MTDGVILAYISERARDHERPASQPHPRAVQGARRAGEGEIHDKEVSHCHLPPGGIEQYDVIKTFKGASLAKSAKIVFAYMFGR